MHFQLIHTYRGHQDTICALAAVPGHAKVVSASRDGLTKVWDLKRDSVSILHTESDCYPTALSVFPAGFFMVAGTSDGALKMWNLESGEIVRHLNGHQAMITSLVITHSGRQFVSASQDHSLRIWDSMTARTLHICQDETGHVEKLAITPDDSVVLGCVAGPERDTASSHIKAWQIETGEAMADADSHYIGGRDLAVLRDGEHIVSSSDDGDIIVWNRTTGALKHHLKTHLGPIVMALMPNEKSIVIGTSKPILTLWQIDSGEKLYQFDEPADHVVSLAVTHNGLYVIAGCHDGSLNFYVRVS